ncbi:alpha-L-rhamnosidase C protein [Coniochaeta hoffmannii]|uniref:Alpha-L-rhamnosidase C protein n=1 Tax=Coniochaeta hoffmannii TaxID=91930 RepID=A0AA38RDH0_9PEZI|nr:alpha-L-rhamnosidase C protein [Coniochaeta hoffmannii]
MATTGEFAASVLSVDRTGRLHRSTSAQSPGTPLAPILSANPPDATTAGSLYQKPPPTSKTEGDAEKKLNGRVVDDERTSDAQKQPASEHTSLAEQRTNDAVLMEPFGNGYHFPPKYSWQESTKQGLITAWKFSTTFWGFFWVLYGLNVVAWGGMLFLLLCNASPAMCHPTCNDINSPRRVWIEIDSQILNALFCVTGFGLAPWRFRDWYYLLKFRVLKQEEALRRLAGLKRDWFRLQGSELLPVDVGPGNIPEGVPLSSVPYPIEKIPEAPLTGYRAPPTALWKMDFFVWTMIGNTFLQAVLSGFMWGMNRYDRPSWSTGLFVALACMVAAAGGFVSFLEGKNVKSIEGVPLTDQDKEKLARDREQGILHYNNIRAKKPKEKVPDEEKQSMAKKAFGLGKSEKNHG